MRAGLTRASLLASIVLVAAGGAAYAQTPTSAAEANQERLVPHFGRYREVLDPFEKPDPALRYRVVFDIGQPARTPGQVHQGLERVARMVNLLNRHGVKMMPGDIVVTIHGQPIRTGLTAAAYAKRFEGAANPDEALIHELAAAGVSVRLCGQTMMGAGYTKDEISPDVKIDVAAITTMATLQLRGYAIIQD